MMKFPAKVNKKSVLLFMFGSAILFSLLGQWVAVPLRRAVSYALTPLGDMGTSVTTGARRNFLDGGKGISAQEANALRREIEDLNHKLEAVLRQRDYFYVRNRYLQQIRKYFDPKLNGCELIDARVVLSPSLPYDKSRTVNVGAVKGVEEGMEVIEVLTDRSKRLPPPMGVMAMDASALVGIVEESGSYVARVQLVTDRNFSLPANIWRTVHKENPRLITVSTAEKTEEVPLSRKNNYPILVQVFGNGNNEIIVHDVPKYHNVMPGDWLWTLGSSRYLPVQLRIGKVVRVEPSSKNPNFVTLRATPATDLDALRTVWILRSKATSLPPRQGGQN